ncbi:anhydro-N-acetylmuramic acid kinase [Microbispora rosea subsp. aerata]|nr:anhydro-N-acetylmuramic acid kinase [Microbispora rosea]GGO11644.1 anhydro-N-acetylmuramic acid kinase [Microbispora rosea subsp. aerata]GIH55728.1 anhydro-N-acetylmuramic acid kinase [Microbispora rosea subsp. aerata]GLJ85973.1 anhydro-N-acetylmuramic acid kinase [Microbispora rosea subsp. aerata]
MEAATSRNPREVGVRVLGLISGTSHDGIDCALVRWSRDGDLLTGAVEHTGTVPYPPGLREMIVAALPPGRTDMGEICRLDTLVGRAFAEAAAACPAADLVCSHGQTMFHWVEDGRVRGTLQLGQPAWIAERLGVPVVSDLRVRDVAAGGQGAPLVSAFDLPLLSGLPATWGRAGALNLGGIANLTVAPAAAEPPTAYDTGPASALIDAAVRAATGMPYDEDGRLAAAGRVHEGLLAELLAEPYYHRPPPKTTGKELFHAGYLERVAGPYGLGLPDLVATLTALTAETVAAEIRRHRLGVVVVSGGGVRNPALMRALRERTEGVRLLPSDELGVPSDAKEAVAFSYLGWLTAHGLPGTVPACTGAAGARMLGTVTPGRGPLRLPEPLAEPPRRVRMGTVDPHTV